MEHYDLIIIGTGSGNSIITPDFDDWNVAIVEKGVFGGTCLNVGCIPSKMFVYAADVIETARHSSKLGVDLSVDAIRWPDIVGRVFGRIDPIAAAGEHYREGLENIDVYKTQARFTGPNRLAVGDTEISGDQIVIATGAKPNIPPISGLELAGYHTSDTIMRLPEVPRHLIIVGGGYIATEMAHVFEAMGSEVTMLVRGPRLLRPEDEEVSMRFTDVFADRCELVLGASVDSVTRLADQQLCIEVSVGGEQFEVRGDEILVATGRTPTSDELDLHNAGIAVADGYVLTDEYMRTNVPGVWALGDVTNPAQLKHTANREAAVVAHNIANPENMRKLDLWPVPHAVFSNPQVASVGETEQELRGSGVNYLVGKRDHGGTAYGWAMEDTTGFCKILADADSRLILGAHIIGPQASTLIHQLIQGMKFGRTVDELADTFLYIHPALSELVENALLDITMQ
ncbi:MAG: mycothione reductase [Acidimicrobiales bacterium]